MAKVQNGIETLPKISTSWVGRTNVIDDRRKYPNVTQSRSGKNKSSAVVEMALQCCTIQTVKRWGLVSFQKHIWKEHRVHGHESYSQIIVSLWKPTVSLLGCITAVSQHLKHRYWLQPCVNSDSCVYF